MEHRTFTFHLSRRWLTVALATLLVGVLVPSVAIAAGGAFTDDDTSIFEADIEWLADAGVTRGCNPPTNDRFCPNENVTRGQMAAFMRRFAQFLGAEDGVVDEAFIATNAQAAAWAWNADKIDGFEPSAFFGVWYCINHDADEGAEATCGMRINVPENPRSRGYLVISASAETWSKSGWDLFSCEVLLDGEVIAGSQRDVTVNFDDGGRENNCVTNAGAEVSSGEHRIVFRVYNMGPNTGIRDVVANAVWTPYGGWSQYW
jgi:hypothetical protein